MRVKRKAIRLYREVIHNSTYIILAKFPHHSGAKVVEDRQFVIGTIELHEHTGVNPVVVRGDFFVCY